MGPHIDAMTLLTPGVTERTHTKWDGFRAIVSTEDGLRVRSRRGWDMTRVLPELQALPVDLVLDGELVAWKGSEPYFPHICRRVLNRDMSVPMTFVIFDVLRRDGVELTSYPYDERRQELEGLKLDGPAWTTCERFDDGPALFTAVCELGFEGVVAKNYSSQHARTSRSALGVQVDELQCVLEREVRELAGRVLGHPQSSALDRSAEAHMGVRLGGQERMLLS
jgi:ATP-dependent DNA ligase